MPVLRRDYNVVSSLMRHAAMSHDTARQEHKQAAPLIAYTNTVQCSRVVIPAADMAVGHRARLSFSSNRTVESRQRVSKMID